MGGAAGALEAEGSANVRGSSMISGGGGGRCWT